MPQPALPFAGLALVVGAGHQEAQRRLEDVLHLIGVDRQGERRVDDPDQRHDAEAGAGEIGIEPAERLDQSGRQADLFGRLAQRGRQRRLALVDLAAGKSDLARMAA